MKGSCLVVLFASSVAAHAQQIAGPTLEALGQGVTLSGTMPAEESPLVPIPMLAGDAVDVGLQGSGYLELESFDAAGKQVGSYSAEASLSSTLRTAADGVNFVAVVANPGTKWSLTLKRVVTGKPPPPPIDPNWGSYARMDGLTRYGSTFNIRWHWETPGQVMLEEWTRKGKDNVIYALRITRGDSPGTLRQFDGKRDWPGTVGSDGSVTWQHGSGMLSLPFTLLLLEDGRVRRNYLKKDGTVRYSDWYVPEGVSVPLPG